MKKGIGGGTGYAFGYREPDGFYRASGGYGPDGETPTPVGACPTPLPDPSPSLSFTAGDNLNTNGSQVWLMGFVDNGSTNTGQASWWVLLRGGEEIGTGNAVYGFNSWQPACPDDSGVNTLQARWYYDSPHVEGSPCYVDDPQTFTLNVICL